MLMPETTAAVPTQPKKGQVKGVWPKLQRLQGALMRHLVAQNFLPYEQLLRYIQERGDIWITSQGEYVAWWQQREKATLTIMVTDGVCRAQTSLKNAVIEKFPGDFLETPVTPCSEAAYSGEVWLTVDSALPQKELLLELLKREGILNFRVGTEGQFMLSRQELEPLLANLETNWQQRLGWPIEATISAVRQLIIDKLAARNLPLLRVWYHPRLNGVVYRAVFSPRYDVDRAITNLARIRAFEESYNVSSTLYIRSFCSFYTDEQIKGLASQPWCSEIALHGEFITNARRYGDEFQAAVAEKSYLEKLTGCPVLGVGMHGGELSYNRSERTDEVMEKAGFVYDTTSRPGRYYFPFRKLVKGHLSASYGLSHALSDVDVQANRDYSQVFYERTVAKIDEIYQQNGVFVLMLHPEYFGFLSYLSRSVNWLPLLKFVWSYLKQSLQRG